MKKKFGDLTLRELANLEPIICDCCPLSYYDKDVKTKRLCEKFEPCLVEFCSDAANMFEREVELNP